MKNLILNPSFDQGPLTTITATTADTDAFLATGWIYTSNTLTNGPLISRTAFAAADQNDPNSTWLLLVSATPSALGAPGANDFVKVTQRIAGVHRRNNQKFLTLSFSAKALNPGEIGLSINCNYGTGGSPTAQVKVLTQIFNVTTKMQRYSVTFMVPDATGKTFGTNLDDYLELNFWLHAGANKAAEAGNILAFDNVVTASLTNFQLEKGATATTFDDDNIAVPQVASIVVDASNGNDTAGKRLGSAVKTLGRAKALAQAGDTIVVMPGTYNEHDLAKHLVNWHFMAGATVTWTDSGTVPSGYAMFDDQNAPITCRITGAGNFTYTMTQGGGGYTGYGGIVALRNAASDVEFQCNDVSITGGVQQANAAFGIWSCANFHLDFNKLTDPAFGSGTSFPVGVYWEKGNTYIRGKFAQLDESFLWAHEPAGAPATSLYADVEHIEGNWNSTLYLTTTGAAANYRVWVNCQQLISTAAEPIWVGGGGKMYVTAQKISNGGVKDAIHIEGFTAPFTPLVWVTAQKISSTSRWVGVANSFAGKVHIACMEYEDLGGIVTGFDFAAGVTGQITLTGGYAKVLAGKAINHAGGTVRLKGMTIDTSNTNALANTPALLVVNGLIFDNCVLITGAASSAARITIFTITNATFATPIVVTAAGHGYATSDSVVIAGVVGNTNANGTWTITVIDANTFSLQTSVGNAGYTSGGTVVRPRTIKNYGSVANIAAAANITTQVGAITVDANVS